MTSFECSVCKAVIPPNVSCCENCETGFAIANERWSQRYELELDQQAKDDYQEYVTAMSYVGEKL